jgi:hypothetical protein
MWKFIAAGFHWLVLACAKRIDLGIYALVFEVGSHRFGTLFGKFLVVLLGSETVSVAGDVQSFDLRALA